jgi:hypothetical protein
MNPTASVFQPSGPLADAGKLIPAIRTIQTTLRYNPNTRCLSVLFQLRKGDASRVRRFYNRQVAVIG